LALSYRVTKALSNYLLSLMVFATYLTSPAHRTPLVFIPIKSEKFQRGLDGVSGRGL